MPVLPFHKYIGPGNPTDNGEPVDEDDRIAKIHDIKYDAAKSDEDVRKADVEAIFQFRKDWREGNWHSLIGDVGLSIKYFIESYTGVIYPRITPVHIENNCQIVHIKNFLKLHCCFKNKPFLDKYESNILVPSENLDYSLYDFVSQRKIETETISPFVYVPIEWEELYLKYFGAPLIWNNCVFCAHNFCDVDNSNRINNTKPFKYKSTINMNLDFFTVNFWLNLALMKYMHDNSNSKEKITKNNQELYELELFRLYN